MRTHFLGSVTAENPSREICPHCGATISEKEPCCEDFLFDASRTYRPPVEFVASQVKLKPRRPDSWPTPIFGQTRPSEGHTGVSGLQKHSVDNLYPWSVVVKANANNGICQARNLITGEFGLAFRYGGWDHRDFESAHQLAEKWILHHIRCHVRTH